MEAIVSVLYSCRKQPLLPPSQAFQECDPRLIIFGVLVAAGIRDQRTRGVSIYSQQPEPAEADCISGSLVD